MERAADGLFPFPDLHGAYYPRLPAAVLGAALIRKIDPDATFVAVFMASLVVCFNRKYCG